jgi:uncharacterized protein YutD
MYKIQEVTDSDLMFGGNINKLMPKYGDIPDEFKSYYNKWSIIVGDWFFKGLNNVKFIPKDGVDTNRALNHINAILRSFEPAHEYKQAGCAYLLSEWFEDITYDNKKRI